MKKFLAVICSLAVLAGGIAMFAGCNSKTPIGFDIELAQAVADKIGVKLRCEEINWDAKEAELENHSIDMAWNGFTYTEARDEGYTDEDGNKIGGLDFSNLYMRNRQVAVVKKENAEKYSTLEAMKNAPSFTAESGSAGFTTIQEVFGKTPTGVVRQVNVFTEVTAGTSEIGVIDAVMAGYYITAETGAYHDSLAVVQIEGVEEEYYAIGFREGSNLPAAFNNILAGLVEDGTMERIAEKYGLQDVIMPENFTDYDANYAYPTDGDYQELINDGEMVLGYTIFAPMAYFE